jgi:hypothetical protein
MDGVARRWGKGMDGAEGPPLLLRDSEPDARDLCASPPLHRWPPADPPPPRRSLLHRHRRDTDGRRLRLVAPRAAGAEVPSGREKQGHGAPTRRRS